MVDKVNPIFEDLGIDTSGFMGTKHQMLEFSRQCVNKARELAAILDSDRSRSATTREDAFKKFAIEDADAAKEAAEAYSMILDVIDNVSPLALVHLAQSLKGLTSNVNDRIRTATFENHLPQPVEEEVNKKTIHTQYVILRNVYQMWMKMVKAFDMLSEKELRQLHDIPAKGGNFDNTNGSKVVKVYENWVYQFTNEDETVDSYYSVSTVARKLLGDNYADVIRTRMDLHEEITRRHNNGEWMNVTFTVTKD